MHGRRLRASAARPRAAHRASIGGQRPAGAPVEPGETGEGAIDMQPSHTAIYARVSSDQQTADKTIASQLAALEARLAREGLRVAPEHRFVDEGYSGATLVRPALERLRDAAAAGALERVYVHSPAPPPSACATRPPPARSIASTSTRPTGWRAATPTRSS